jgi:hypothetical protein
VQRFINPRRSKAELNARGSAQCERTEGKALSSRGVVWRGAAGVGIVRGERALRLLSAFVSGVMWYCIHNTHELLARVYAHVPPGALE